MKPAWDKLTDAYSSSKFVLIADVDCTAAGKSLCETQGVRGYPSIKYGKHHRLQDYVGGREEESLMDFVAKELVPNCSPHHEDFCSEQQKKDLDKLLSLDQPALAKLVEGVTQELSELEEEEKAEHDSAAQEIKELREKMDRAGSDTQTKLELRLMKRALLYITGGKVVPKEGASAPDRPKLTKEERRQQEKEAKQKQKQEKKEQDKKDSQKRRQNNAEPRRRRSGKAKPAKVDPEFNAVAENIPPEKRKALKVMGLSFREAYDLGIDLSPSEPEAPVREEL